MHVTDPSRGQINQYIFRQRNIQGGQNEYSVFESSMYNLSVNWFE